MSGNILITGFGPFGEHLINASWESVKLLPDNMDGYKVIKQEISVSYQHVEEHIPELWKNLNPQLVIHVGVSGVTSVIQIETQAFSKGYKKPDCNQCLRNECSLDGEDEVCLRTELDVEKYCKSINECNNVVVQSSSDAGRYLCEFIYFTSLKMDPKKTLFIHVPPLEKPYSAQTIANCLQDIIKCALKDLNCLCEKTQIQIPQ